MYIKITDGLVERYTFRQLRRDNPQTSFPEVPSTATLAVLGVYCVSDAAQPAPSASQVVVRDAQPVKQGDWTYVWGWSLQDKTHVELSTQARTQRNALLAASDWTQVADAPVDQAAWATYRQALRDVTTQTGFPTSIAWPVAPE